MKNLINIFSILLVIIMTLNSCNGTKNKSNEEFGQFSKNVNACECAKLSVEALTAGLETMELSEEERNEAMKVWEEKLAPCEKQFEEDEEFKKEMEECILKVLEEELGEELGEVQE